MTLNMQNIVELPTRSSSKMRRAISVLRNSFKHELVGFVIIGVLLRIVLMPYFVWPYDMSAYQSSLVYFMNGKDPYALHASIYPPLTYFVTFPMFGLAYQFGISFDFHSILEVLSKTSVEGPVPITQISPLFLVFWKIPILCFDLLTGILIYYFVKAMVSDTTMPKRCFLVWLFNPFTLVLSYLQGSFDIVVAFFILLGAFFLFRDDFLFSGLSFGLGTLAKTSPIFVAIPLAAVLLIKGVSGSSKTLNLKLNIRTFLKFTIGCVLPLLCFAPLAIEYLNLMWSGISEEASIAGGLNQWFFAADPLRSGWINQHIVTIQTVFKFYSVIALTIAVVFSGLLKLGRKRILLLTAFFANLIYFFLPMTLQPQYLLWTLPLFAVLMSSTKRYLWSLCLYSAAGLFFILSLQGPQIFLYPLAMYTSLYPPKQLTINVMNYVNLPGVFSQNLRQDFCTVFGCLGFIGLSLTMVLLVKSILVEKDNE